MIVTALQTFSQGGRKYKRGDTANIVSSVAHDLRTRGLVSFNGLPHDPPSQAGGEPSSVSLPAQAAPTTTLTESSDGDSKPKRKRKAKETEPTTDDE